MPAIPAHEPVPSVTKAARELMPAIRELVQAAARDHSESISSEIRAELARRRAAWQEEEDRRTAAGRPARRPPFPRSTDRALNDEAIAAAIALAITDHLDTDLTRPLAADATAANGPRSTVATLNVIAVGAGLAGRAGVDKRIGATVTPAGHQPWDDLIHRPHHPRPPAQSH